MADFPDLIIAFAFSLKPDGAPGPYNQQLAERLEQRPGIIRTATGHLPDLVSL